MRRKNGKNVMSTSWALLVVIADAAMLALVALMPSHDPEFVERNPQRPPLLIGERSELRANDRLTTAASRGRDLVDVGSGEQRLHLLPAHLVHGRRRHQGRRPCSPRRRPTERRERRSISGPKLWTRDLALEHLQLVTKDEDLDLLHTLRPHPQHEQLQQPPQRPV
jgi:hypothetical protein